MGGTYHDPKSVKTRRARRHGLAEKWESAEIDGRLGARGCTITYRKAGRKLAVAVIHRELAGLRAEVEFEKTSRP